MRTTQRQRGIPTLSEPRSLRTTRESLSTKLIAGGLGIIIGAGGLALGEKFWPHDPNELQNCDNDWAFQSIDKDSIVTSMPRAMAALESGRSELVARIHEARASDYSIIGEDSIPSPYKGAAKLLIDNESGFTNYDTSKAKLDTPREEFCKDPDSVLFGIYKTPEYVRAEAALDAVGIDISTAAGVSGE